MLVDLLVIYFLISFIPAIREYFKKTLKKTFIIFGFCLIIMQSIFSFYVFPKLISLFEQAPKVYNMQLNIMLLALAFLMALSIFVLGLKVIKVYKSNLAFYLAFGFFCLFSILIVQIDVLAIINPIYQLTTSYQ